MASFETDSFQERREALAGDAAISFDARRRKVRTYSFPAAIRLHSISTYILFQCLQIMLSGLDRIEATMKECPADETMPANATSMLLCERVATFWLGQVRAFE
jgi:hypothetical protein